VGRFVLPTLLFFAVFKYGPMVWAIELSFNSYDMVSAPYFVGLDNYRARHRIRSFGKR
jgi:multiple sugar transport system permease protein